MLRHKIRTVILLTIGILFIPMPVFALNSSSSNYSIQQVFFGSGSSINLSSPNYSAQSSVGDLGIGNSTSLDYQAYAGFNTSDAPYLQLDVTQTNINLGYLSISSTATATATFFVRAWLAHGYSVQTISPPPYNGSQYISTPTEGTSAASSTGTEQFGMNLVANTSPITFGASPNEAFSYSYGQAVAPYATANQYAYGNGDTIAQSTKSSGSTIYTISYIFNISPSTADGTYNFNQVINVVGTY